MHKALVEGLGTFFLVLVIGLSVIAPGAGAMAPLAIGAALMVLVYAGGPISGAHYNPAVTLAATLAGKCEWKDTGSYMIAQVIGAVLASAYVGLLKPDSLSVPMQPAILPALLAELAFTFLLAYVVLNVTTTKKSAGNSYFGLAIGFTVMAAAYAVGNISGGAFNPAVAVGVTLMNLVTPSSLWIYLVANFAGGALAAQVFRLTNPDTRKA